MILGQVDKTEGEEDFGDVPEGRFPGKDFEVELINFTVKLLAVLVLGLFVLFVETMARVERLVVVGRRGEGVGGVGVMFFLFGLVHEYDK